MSEWRDGINRKALARLDKALPEVFPPPVLTHAMGRRFAPPRPRLFNPVVQLLHGDSEGFAVEVKHFEDFVRDVRDSQLCHNHLVFGSTRRRIGQQRTIEARFLLSTVIL